ncbi:MAG: hypothetical protein M0R22_11340 [Dehalococcoidia bacterium]|nr:hypothetical protein [Dehalococcoidia bacterium]
MAGKNTVEIGIKVKDDASKPLKDVSKALDDTGKAAHAASKSGQDAMGGLSKGATAAAGAIGGVAAKLTEMLTRAAFEVMSWPAEITKGLLDMTVQAASLQGVEAAYKGVTGGGEAMLQQLREQSSFMIADRELMKSYNLAAMLVSKTFANKLPDAMKYLTKISTATGQSMDYMMESLVRGIGRMSPLILDNLGIQVDLEGANKRYAASIGKTVEQLTKQEQQIALTNEVMLKLAANTASMPDVAGTASAGLAALNAMWRNFKDEIGTAALPALQSVLTLLNELRPVFQEAVRWIGDLVHGWADGFAQLVANAATWGANLVESLASGISGSGAISRALRGVADQITYWLQPGSPPNLLPDLPEWGAGALESWLSGWTMDAVAASAFLQNLRGNLKPFLEAIDLGKGIDEGGLRDVFGGDAPAMRRYLQAYQGVGRAVNELKDAREGLKKAEEGGDEEAIKAARTRVKTAEDEEYSARRTYNAEERRLEQRISAEAQIARAVTATAAVQAKAASDSARLAEEAKKRAIEQAYLQYKLAVAGTPQGQIDIWEEELAKAEQGSAEYWQIMTRLVELRRQAAKGAGTEIGGAMGEGLDEGLTDATQKAGGGLRTKIDWAGIGTAIGGAIVDGIMIGLTSLLTRVTAWATDPARTDGAWASGTAIGNAVVNGVRTIFGLPALITGTSDSIAGHLQAAAWEAGPALAKLALETGEAFAWTLAAAITPGGATGEQLAAAWEMFKTGTGPGSALAAKWFGAEGQAAQVAESWRKIAEDPTVSAAVQGAAEDAAQYWIDKYGLKIDAVFGVVTAERFNELALERGVIGAAETAGAAAGTAYGNAASDAAELVFSANPPYFPPPGTGMSRVGSGMSRVGPGMSRVGPGNIPAEEVGKPGYAKGGIVTEPTLAWIGEAGPELIVPLPRGYRGQSGGQQVGNSTVYYIDIPIDARGSNAREVRGGVLAGLRAAGIPINN